MHVDRIGAGLHVIILVLAGIGCFAKPLAVIYLAVALREKLVDSAPRNPTHLALSARPRRKHHIRIVLRIIELLEVPLVIYLEE